MSDDLSDILADYRADRIDYGTAYALLAYFGHPAPGLALNPPITAGQPQGWDAVYRRSA